MIAKPEPARAPVASVIVPCYNHAAFVREAIASVWAQTHPAVELVVVDDASSDGSAEVIEAARAERPFAFLRNERNLGLNASLERALERVSGEFVSILASDDAIERTKLAEQVAVLLRDGLDGVFATGTMLHPDGRREVINLDALARRFHDGSILRLLYTSDTHGPLLQSGLFRTEVMRALAPVRRGFKSDDWALTIAMLEKYRIGFLNRPLFLYRQHADNSHRSYWRTFPMRAEVICLLAPEELRREGLANLLESQAAYLLRDGRREGLRFQLAALALHPARARAVAVAKELVRPMLGPLLARRRRRLGP